MAISVDGGPASPPSPQSRLFRNEDRPRFQPESLSVEHLAGVRTLTPWAKDVAVSRGCRREGSRRHTTSPRGAITLTSKPNPARRGVAKRSIRCLSSASSSASPCEPDEKWRPEHCSGLYFIRRFSLSCEDSRGGCSQLDS